MKGKGNNGELHISACPSSPCCGRMNMGPGRPLQSLENFNYGPQWSTLRSNFYQKPQSLLSSAGFTVHIHLPKSKWIAWFERHLFPSIFVFFFWQLGWYPCFPHNQALQNYMLVHSQCGKNTKVWFSGDSLPQFACRLSQGGLWGWLLCRMSVCGGEHPGMQRQKWQLHLQIWLPRQQMPERYNLMLHFLSSLITVLSLCSAPSDH